MINRENEDCTHWFLWMNFFVRVWRAGLPHESRTIPAGRHGTDHDGFAAIRQEIEIPCAVWLVRNSISSILQPVGRAATSTGVC